MVMSLSEARIKYFDSKKQLEETLVSIAEFYSDYHDNVVEEDDNEFIVKELRRQAKEIVRTSNWVHSESGLRRLQAKIELFQKETGLIWNDCSNEEES